MRANVNKATKNHLIIHPDRYKLCLRTF